MLVTCDEIRAGVYRPYSKAYGSHHVNHALTGRRFAFSREQRGFVIDEIMPTNIVQVGWVHEIPYPIRKTKSLPGLRVIIERSPPNERMDNVEGCGIDGGSVVRNVPIQLSTRPVYYKRHDDVIFEICQAINENREVRSRRQATDEERRVDEIEEAEKIVNMFRQWFEQARLARKRFDETGDLFHAGVNVRGRPWSDWDRSHLERYLNAPSQPRWQLICANSYLPNLPLLRAWLLLDKNAPSFEDSGCPQADTLVEAMRLAIDSWPAKLASSLEEAEWRLAEAKAKAKLSSHPVLRVV